MEAYEINWQRFINENISEEMAGLDKKARYRLKRKRELSKRTLRSLGSPDEIIPGETDLKQLGNGILENENEDDKKDQLDELNPIHDKKTGRFPKGGAKAGDTYSLSKGAVAKAGIDSKHAKKGIYSSKKDKTGKLTTYGKYGMTDKCGRKTLDNKDINPEIYCSQYPKPYPTTYQERQNRPSSNDNKVSREYVRSTFELSLKNAMNDLRNMFKQSQNPKGACSLEQIIRIMDKWELAQKGKAFQERPK